MKNSFTISVPKPCDASWSDFTPTVNGGYCHLCSKEVTDFTRMSDEDIIQWFSQNKKDTCGKFRESQLSSHNRIPMVSVNSLKWISAGVFSMFMFLSAPALNAQDIVETSNSLRTEILQTSVPRTISGIVKDEFGDVLTGANIILKGTNVGVVADIDGKFTFPQKLDDGDVLVFSFVGYETQEYVISDKTPENIEIEMILDAEITGELIIVGGVTHRTFFGRMWDKVRSVF